MPLAERQPYLEAVDAALVPRGFERSKGSQEWSKRVLDDRLWVHLNFGQIVINPSAGVEYMDLRRRWSAVPGAVYETFVSLSSRFNPPRGYSTSDSPSRIVADLLDVGLSITDELRNREAVIAALSASAVRAWPTGSFSERIRLLPILLMGLGRLDEAKGFASSVAADAATRDQMQPPFAAFLSALENIRT